MLYMEIANIHSVRGSADALQSMCEDGSEEKWLSRLEQTGWLRQVHSVLSAGCALARKMSNEKMSCKSTRHLGYNIIIIIIIIIIMPISQRCRPTRTVTHRVVCSI